MIFTFYSNLFDTVAALTLYFSHLFISTFLVCISMSIPQHYLSIKYLSLPLNLVINYSFKVFYYLFLLFFLLLLIYIPLLLFIGYFIYFLRGF